MPKHSPHYAIIATGGKQYRVEPGDRIRVELLKESSDTISLDQVLLIHDESGISIGQPHLDKCSVTAKILGESKGDKVLSFRYFRRKSNKRTVGHRQKYHELEITSINRNK